MIRDVHPGSRILILYPSWIPDPGSRGQKYRNQDLDPKSATLVFDHDYTGTDKEYVHLTQDE
jgi:hypothetical protein